MAEVKEDLVKRFLELEASQAELREQLAVFISNGSGKIGKISEQSLMGGNQDMVNMAGNFMRNPYQSVLHQLGHAVFICSPVSGEIIYWNPASELLYGWKCYEALNYCATDLFIDASKHSYWKNIMESTSHGEKWSGQFSFRKRLGELFIALVTMSPLYENGTCTGVITVSSDASKLNNPRSQTQVQFREPKLNSKRLYWPPHPQLTSSFSNLAGKVLAKLHIRVNGGQASEFENKSDTNSANVSEDGSLQNDRRQPNEMDAECCNSCYHTALGCKLQTNIDNDRRKENFDESCSKETRDPLSCRSGSKSPTQSYINPTKGIDSLQNGEKLQENPPDQTTVSNKNALQVEDAPHSNSPPSTEVIGSSQTTSSNTEDLEESLVEDSEIRWEDLALGEDIGEGSFAVVYHGLWNGSDVAIKVLARMGYRDSVLIDYKKEIAIMKKLRHPNVLLFMGAVYSPERLAIVTEYLSRGSLFRTLHKNRQALVLRRRLRMALDVARGMNYLHLRRPPIIHRDLKSSNLLVDKFWRVKVGDFGLSCLKMSTVLTAKTGRGTPQWMAPEVLRGECSSEKSDVFSFGVVLWELMTKFIPWSHLNSMSLG